MENLLVKSEEEIKNIQLQEEMLLTTDMKNTEYVNIKTEPSLCVDSVTLKGEAEVNNALYYIQPDIEDCIKEEEISFENKAHIACEQNHFYGNDTFKVQKVVEQYKTIQSDVFSRIKEENPCNCTDGVDKVEQNMNCATHMLKLEPQDNIKKEEDMPFEDVNYLTSDAANSYFNCTHQSGSIGEQFEINKTDSAEKIKTDIPFLFTDSINLVNEDFKEIITNSKSMNGSQETNNSRNTELNPHKKHDIHTGQDTKQSDTETTSVCEQAVLSHNITSGLPEQSGSSVVGITNAGYNISGQCHSYNAQPKVYKCDMCVKKFARKYYIYPIKQELITLFKKIQEEDE